MNNRRLHINRIFATLLLWVFAIALTPWSSLHHHEEQSDYCAKSGKECMHKVHVGSERHNCLICSAHFEKDYYTVVAIAYQAKLESKAIEKKTML
ncbi:hypothetical protein [Pedobacter sp. NJ-S-72]